MRFALPSRSLYRRPCMASECGPNRRYVILTSPVYTLAYASTSVHQPASIGRPHNWWLYRHRARHLVAKRRCSLSVPVPRQRQRLGRVRPHRCQLQRVRDAHQVAGRDRLVLVDEVQRRLVEVRLGRRHAPLLTHHSLYTKIRIWRGKQIIYFFFTGRRIVYLHGFQKKVQKIPARELALARKRAIAFRAREEQG